MYATLIMYTTYAMLKPKRVALFIEPKQFKAFKLQLYKENISISKKLVSWISAYLNKPKVTENKTTKPIPEVSEVVEPQKVPDQIHDYGVNGNGICFKCSPPHKA